MIIVTESKQQMGASPKLMMPNFADTQKNLNTNIRLKFRSPNISREFTSILSAANTHNGEDEIEYNERDTKYSRFHTMSNMMQETKSSLGKKEKNMRMSQNYRVDDLL